MTQFIDSWNDYAQWGDSEKCQALETLRGISLGGCLYLTPYGLTVTAGAIVGTEQGLTESDAASLSAFLAPGKAWESLDPETWEGGIRAENDGLARWYRLACIGVETCQRFDRPKWRFSDYAAGVSRATNGISQEAFL